MPGSVRHLGAWHKYNPDTGTYEPVPEMSPGEGDYIKLRPLARWEWVEALKTLPEDWKTPGVPPVTARAILVFGIQDWTFKDDHGKRLPVTDEEKGYLDDVTTDYAVTVILEQSRPRSQGEGKGSVTES